MENNQNNRMEMAGGDKNGQSGVVYGKIGKGQSAAGDHPTGSGMPQDGRPGKHHFSRKNRSSGTEKKMVTRGIAVLLCILMFSFGLVAGRIWDFSGTDQNGYKKIHSLRNYIAVLDVQGTMGYSSGSYFQENPYDQAFLLDSIDQLKKDRNNKALILRINTPGGDAYAIDELYQKIIEYKKTGKPVYTYMESQACSGGYYVASPSNKIYANRNAWTGSIGVTMGTFYDVSGLLDKLGIKTQTITSGPNKAMGSMTEPMTDEQKEIFKGLIDQSYEQFVGVVAKGRKMPVKKVKELADGRVYTAEQALNNGLIDKISSEDQCYREIKSSNGLENCEIRYIAKDEDKSLLQTLTGMTKLGGLSMTGQYKQAMELIQNGGTSFSVMYISQVRK